jgi:hypothetical protein
MRRRKFDPEIPDLGGVIKWLRDHGLTPKETADILAMTPNYVNVSLHRSHLDENPKRILPLLGILDARGTVAEDQSFFTTEDDVDWSTPTKGIQDIERRIEKYEKRVWRGVRNLKGAAELGRLLRTFSRPASDNIPLLRLLARVHHLESQTYSHAGYSKSALECGLKAYGYCEYIYRQTHSPLDLERLAKTVLVISNSFISRGDIKRARVWLNIARQAFAEISTYGRDGVDPEYLRQLASTQRNSGQFDEARKNLSRAGTILPTTQPNVTPAAVKDMGDRVLYVIGRKPEWDKSRELLESALDEWPEYDHHRASNLNWTVACGHLTDSPSIHREVERLLLEHGNEAQGFGLQSTATYLLSLTPRIPERLRHDWVFFALSYNAYRNK